ncbi:hypothetical protein C8T65DRAFT_663325 [Cerioporus squamosus]|nr:hypothetical protein C8T65DRAFT_663325 [Cerioporus squamosus]
MSDLPVPPTLQHRPAMLQPAVLTERHVQLRRRRVPPHTRAAFSSPPLPASHSAGPSQLHSTAPPHHCLMRCRVSRRPLPP